MMKQRQMQTTPKPDHRILSFGGGKQSTVLLLMAAEGAFGDPPDVALFSDTRWEPEHVYRHIEWMKSVSTIPIRTLSSGRDLRAESAGEREPGEELPVLRLPLYVIGEDGSRGMLQHRQCTDIFKLRPALYKNCRLNRNDRTSHEKSGVCTSHSLSRATG